MAILKTKIQVPADGKSVLRSKSKASLSLPSGKREVLPLGRARLSKTKTTFTFRLK